MEYKLLSIRYDVQTNLCQNRKFKSCESELIRKFLLSKNVELHKKRQLLTVACVAKTTKACYRHIFIRDAPVNLTSS